MIPSAEARQIQTSQHLVDAVLRRRERAAARQPIPRSWRTRPGGLLTELAGRPMRSDDRESRLKHRPYAA